VVVRIFLLARIPSPPTSRKPYSTWCQDTANLNFENQQQFAEKHGISRGAKNTQSLKNFMCLFVLLVFHISDAYGRFDHEDDLSKAFVQKHVARWA